MGLKGVVPPDRTPFGHLIHLIIDNFCTSIFSFFWSDLLPLLWMQADKGVHDLVVSLCRFSVFQTTYCHGTVWELHLVPSGIDKLICYVTAYVFVVRYLNSKDCLFMLIYVGLSVPDFLSNFQEVANRLHLRLLGKNILSAPLSFARTLTYPDGGVLGSGSPLAP